MQTVCIYSCFIYIFVFVSVVYVVCVVYVVYVMYVMYVCMYLYMHNIMMLIFSVFSAKR